MEIKEYIDYLIKNVSTIFPEIKVIQNEYENVMGFILVLGNDNIQLSFTLERGFTLQGEIINVNLENNLFKKYSEKIVTNNGKNYLLFHSIDPSLLDLKLSIENIDLFTDFLNKNKNDIFVD